MISDIGFNTGPILPGESRPIKVMSDSSPISLEIYCFVEPPIPAQLVPCNECGSYKINSGDVFNVTASSSVFMGAKGSLEIIVTDSSGDQKKFILDVLNRTDSRGGMSHVAR